MDKKVARYLTENCVGEIDKFTTEFTVLSKDNNLHLITYSEEFDSCSGYGKEVTNEVSKGWEIVYEGNEFDAENVRYVTEDGADVSILY